MKVEPSQAASLPRHPLRVWDISVAHPLRVWAKLALVFLLSLVLRDHGSIGRTLITVAGGLCALGIHEATRDLRKGMLVRSLILCYGFLETTCLVMCIWEKKAVVSAHILYDVGASLYSVTPQLIACFSGAPLVANILFVVGHVARSSIMHFSLGTMAWPFAILRAVSIHTMVVAAALLILARTRVLMQDGKCGYQHQQHEKRQHEQQQQQQQSNKVVDKEQQLDGQAENIQRSTRSCRNGLEGGDWDSPHPSRCTAQHMPEPSSPSSHWMRQETPATYPRSQKSVLKAVPVPEARRSQEIHGAPQPRLQKSVLESVLEARRSSHGGAYTSKVDRKLCGSSNLGVQKTANEAVRALEGRRKQGAYTSQVAQPSSPDKRLRKSLQNACRFAVKLNNASTPADVPEGGLPQLQLKLQKYHQCLAPAIRAGCLVISYDADMSVPGLPLDDVCEAVLAEAKEWAAEQGLLQEATDDAVTVQRHAPT